MGTARSNLVLLGDPLQLAQVSQAAPRGAGVSVLEHLLGERTARSRPTAACSSTRRGACTLTSAVRLRGDLRGALESLGSVRQPAHRFRGELDRHRRAYVPSTTRATRAIARGGRGDRRRDRATCSAAATFTKGDGDARRHSTPRRTSWSSPPTTHRCAACAQSCPTASRVGTVDKFQGQEAAVVFFSMATSSGEEFRATWSSCSAATGSTSPSRAPSASPCSSAPQPKTARSAVETPSRCGSSTRFAGSVEMATESDRANSA